jgi:DNA-binding HxlR family transcriptional regulator
MVTKRTSCDGCAAAHALDIIGERWALLVVRELLLGPRRFTDLRAGLPDASPNVLAQQPRGLERAGVIRRRKLLPPAASRVYEITEWGEELEPIIIPELAAPAVEAQRLQAGVRSGLQHLRGTGRLVLEAWSVGNPTVQDPRNGA